MLTFMTFSFAAKTKGNHDAATTTRAETWSKREISVNLVRKSCSFITINQRAEDV